MRLKKRAIGQGPFFRSSGDLDLLSGGGSSEESESDLEDAPLREFDSDEDEQNRPGEYPESESDEDPYAVEEDEDGDDGEEEEIRGDRDPDRDWKSVAKENDRRLRRMERKYESTLVELAKAARVPAQPQAPRVPETPPHTVVKIAEAQQEGHFQEAVQMLQENEIWREAKLREDVSAQGRIEAESHRLESRVKSRLNFRKDDPFSRAVRERRDELMEDYPSMSEVQATMMASAEVGAEVGRKGPRRDLREESKRREERRRPKQGRREQRARPAEGGGIRITNAMRGMLDRSGLQHYLKLANSSNARTRKDYRGRIARLAQRIDQVNEGDI